MLLKALLKAKFRKKGMRHLYQYRIISITYPHMMTLKNKGGLVKMFAMVAISDYQVSSDSVKLASATIKNA
jgi:hypothetical protein